MKRFLLLIILLVVLRSESEMGYGEEKGVEGDTVGVEKDTFRITVACVGDIMMGTTFPYNRLPPDSGKGLFRYVKDIIGSAQIAIGNLEGPLCNYGTTTKNVKSGRAFAFRTPEHFVMNLKDAGFDVMNIANNHSMDFGIYGVNRTKRLLDSVGIQYTGMKGDVAKFKLDSLKVAVIGFSTYFGMYNLLKVDEARKVVKTLSDSNYIVIVTFHGGTEGERALHIRDAFEYLYGEPRGNLIRFAHACIDAGADLVFGHGPHVPRALELYRDRLIAYSLGNFCTYGGISLRGSASLAPLLWVEMDREGRFVRGRIYSFKQLPPGGPVPDTTLRAFKLIKKLTQEDFPSSPIEFLDNGEFHPAPEGSTSPQREE